MKYSILYTFFRFLDVVFFKKRLPGIPVLLYHALGSEHSRLFIPPLEFERQIRFLSENGFRSILPDELPVRRGDEKVCLITFDDGFVSVYDTALPILRKYGFVATLFVATGYIGKHSGYARGTGDEAHRLLGAAELQDLALAGWRIANHLHSHRDLRTLSPQEIALEYRTSYEELSRLGFASGARFVAYPCNCFTQEAMDILAREGVRLAFIGENRLYAVSGSSFAIPRMDVTKSFARFKLFLSPSFHLVRNFFHEHV